MGRTDSVYRIEVTIESGEAVSSPADISKLSMRGAAIQTENSWTAADIVFQFSIEDEAPSDDGDWLTLYAISQDGTTSSPAKIPGIVTDAANIYPAPAELWYGGNYKWMRLCSRSTSNSLTPVNQSGERTLYIGTLA